MKIMENSDLLTKGKPEWAASVSKMRKAFIGAVRQANSHYEEWQDTYTDKS